MAASLLLSLLDCVNGSQLMHLKSFLIVPN
jgi:hypothetical protein